MDQNFITADEARGMAEERLVIFRNERKDNKSAQKSLK